MGSLRLLIKKFLSIEFKQPERGQLLIEAIVAMAISGILLPALVTGLIASRSGLPQQSQRAAAVALLKEAEEAIRSIREKGWSNFNVNGTYHPVVSSNAWSLSSGSEVVNGFTRSLTISDVYRNSSGVVVSNGGTLDPSTKKIDLSVMWDKPYIATVSSSMYVTRFQKNAANTQTSSTDFNAGTLTDTAVIANSGGEVTLSPNTKGKWCSPSFSTTTIDLPDGPPVAVAATASASTATIPNDVFVATAPYSTTSGKLAYVNVTANVDPPVASLKGIFTLDAARYSAPARVPTGINLDNNFKTNDVRYYKSTSGKTYALLATTKPDHEVIAILVNDNNASNDNTNNGEFQDYVNGIYKYWTFFNTQMYPFSGSTNTGFLNPSTNAADTGGDGNGYEGTASNAYTNNNSYATDTNSGSGTGTNCTGSDKDKHRFYDYGINVPSGTTVNGIQVQINAKVDSTTGSPFICVQLSWDGGTTWTSAKSTSNLTTSNAAYTLGTSADNWGHTWSSSELADTNFRVRVIDVSSNTSRDFSLDYVGVKTYYTGGIWDDQAPWGYGATSLAVLGDTGYVTSGGYLYAFNLSNIDSKTTSSGLDQIGCRIQIDGFDCKPGVTPNDEKYSAGETGASWSTTTGAAHPDCSDGGNIELNADNDVYPVKVGANTYLYIAVGAGTNPELDIVNATTVPDASSTPSISNSSCGISGAGNTNAGWKLAGYLDFNNSSNTEEAANSVYANSDGSRAYISSNGGIDANHDGQPDSKQFYIINTSDKTAPAFLSGTSSGPTTGYYYGSGANAELYPRRSLTVLNGQRAILVGKDAVSNANNAAEYQALNIDNEASPLFCGSVDYNQGFNDLTSIVEADRDTFVYMVANTTVNELKVIQGGPDGTYLASGTYESAPKDLGASVALNRFSVTATVSANTTLQFQFAATAPVGGLCSAASYTYIGPDGTTSTFFPSNGGTIPLTGVAGFSNPAECIRYKAWLTTSDYNVTPSILDASVNYSP